MNAFDLPDVLCALSGASPTPEEEPVESTEDDPMEDTPVGWLRITIERRLPNDEYDVLEATMLSAVETAISQVPREHRKSARPQIRMAVRAQFAALEARIPRYMTEQATVYVAPPSRDAQLAAAIGQILDALGVRPAFPSLAGLPEGKDEDDDAAPDETAPDAPAAPAEGTPASDTP